MSDHERMMRARAMAAGAGISQEHLKFVIDYFDRRTTELIDANSRIVEERRIQTRRADDAEKNIEFLLGHNGIRQLQQLEDELAKLKNYLK